MSRNILRKVIYCGKVDQAAAHSLWDKRLLLYYTENDGAYSQ